MLFNYSRAFHYLCCGVLYQTLLQYLSFATRFGMEVTFQLTLYFSLLAEKPDGGEGDTNVERSVELE